MHATYRTETLDKMERSSFLDSEVALLNQLVAEIGANRPTWQLKFPNLRTTEGRPRKYYWTDKTEAEEIDEAEEAGNDFPPPLKEQASAQPRALERDRYPMHIDFVSSAAGRSENNS